MSSVVTHFQGKAVPLDTQAIVTAALALPPEERVDLAEALMLSLDQRYLAEVEAAQIAEIERRLDNADESTLIPLEEAMKMAKSAAKAMKERMEREAVEEFIDAMNYHDRRRQVLPDEIRIKAVMHTSRRPGYWMDRL